MARPALVRHRGVHRLASHFPRNSVFGSSLTVKRLSVSRSPASSTIVCSAAKAHRVYVRPIKVKPASVDKSPYEPEKRSHVPVISFDGGGMRGILAARVAEGVQSALVTVVKKRLQEDPKLFEWQYEGAPPDEWHEVSDVGALLNQCVDVQVHLADVFDVCSGTSTGSILASYFATKGGNAPAIFARMRDTLTKQADLVKELDSRMATLETKYADQRRAVGMAARGSKERSDAEDALQDTQRSFVKVIHKFRDEKCNRDDEKMWSIWMARQYKKFMELRGLDPLTVDLPKGSALAAQALFVAVGKRIFEERSVKVAPLAPFFNISKLDLDNGWADKIIDRVIEWVVSDIKVARVTSSTPLPNLAETIKGLRRGLKALLAETKLYGTSGIEYTLKQLLGENTRFSDSPEAGGVHTGLVIPSFHVQQNRACIFWAKPQLPRNAAAASNPSSPGSAAVCKNYFGFVTVHREGPASNEPKGARLLHDDSFFKWPAPGQAAPPFTVRYHMGSASAIFPLDFTLWQVVRASTAAPSFFPGQVISARGVAKDGQSSSQVLQDATFVDGGVVANDPTLEAINCALMFRSNPDAVPAVLSIGTGTSECPVNLSPNQGVLLWLWTFATNVLWNAQPETTTASVLYMLNSLKHDGPVIPALRVQAQVLQPGTTSAVEMDLPTWGVVDDTTGKMGLISDPPTTSSPIKDHQLHWADVVESMDVPENWDALLDIGAKVAKKYKEELELWVERYIVP